MKVLLVKPHSFSDHIQPSLGLGYLATSIRDWHDVRILDCIKDGVTADKFPSALKKHNPDVLGLQCYTFDLDFAKKAFRIAKGQNRNIVTVLGGPHPSAVGAGALEIFKDDLDFAFIGEAETGLRRLLDLLERGEKDFDAIPGLVWRDGERLRTNERRFADDLDSLGFPAWDIIQPQTYPEAQHGAFFRKFPIAPIMLTRGCPFPCTFCAGGVISGKKIRKRSIDNVLKEILYLYKDFGIREFHIIDDNFTMDTSYAKGFLRKLKGLNLDISWAVPNGVRMDTLDEEMLRLMKETGLYLISLGIESGSDRVLRDMRKNMTVSRIRECVRLINKAGIDIAGFFILGFPAETEETIRDTIRFSLELGLVRANYFTYLPFPGSESYKDLRRRGELDGVDWQHFYFMNAAYVPKGMTRKTLKGLQRIAFAKFYLRPRIIIYNIRSIKSFRHLLFLVRRFFRWIVKN